MISSKSPHGLAEVAYPIYFRWNTFYLQEKLPDIPVAGMYNKYGGKVRLTFKLQLDQLWIGTKGLLYVYLIAGSYF